MSLDDKASIQHYDKELALHDDPKIIEAAIPEYVEGTAEEKRLVRKIDLHLIPILWAMYIFNYLDRTNIGVSGTNLVMRTYALGIVTDLSIQNAKVGGMEEDLKLSSSDYSLVLSIFFVVGSIK